MNNIIKTITAVIINMYFERTNKAKLIPEYSTIYSDLNSASDSATSKGIFLISVNIIIIYRKTKGRRAKNNVLLLPCLNIILRKLNVPQIKIDLNITTKVDSL